MHSIADGTQQPIGALSQQRRAVVEPEDVPVSGQAAIARGGDRSFPSGTVPGQWRQPAGPLPHAAGSPSRLCMVRLRAAKKGSPPGRSSSKSSSSTACTSRPSATIRCIRRRCVSSAAVCRLVRFTPALTLPSRAPRVYHVTSSMGSGAPPSMASQNCQPVTLWRAISSAAARRRSRAPGRLTTYVLKKGKGSGGGWYLGRPRFSSSIAAVLRRVHHTTQRCLRRLAEESRGGEGGVWWGSSAECRARARHAMLALAHAPLLPHGTPAAPT